MFRLGVELLLHGEVGVSVAVEVAGRQGPAEFVPVLGQRGRDVGAGREAGRPAPDDGEDTERVGGADPLGVHADHEVGVPVAVEVARGEPVTEVVTGLRSAGDARGGLADDLVLGLVEAALGAVDDRDVTGPFPA